jgi:hypothetical protein
LAGQIRLGDVSALLQFEKAAATLDPNNSAGNEAVGAILWAFKNPDPAGVASLGRMATAASAPAKLQYAAAKALMAIHTSDALPYLGRLLSNPEAQMRLCGALGLASFVNGIADVYRPVNPQPTAYSNADTARHINHLAEGEIPFVAFWQAWWQEHPELSMPQ